MAEQKESWHLDRKVPISLIVAILIQTVYMTWWASAIETRVNALETSSEDQQDNLTLTESKLNEMNVTLTRIDTTLGYLLQELRKE